MADTLMAMIVNRGATILTQTLETMASSSDEDPWNGISVKLLKENEIGFILDLTPKTYSVKKKMKNINARTIYVFSTIVGFFCFDTWRQ